MTGQDADEMYYALDLVTPNRPSLSGSQEFDAVVVGAGFAGISAALEFAAEGMSTIVLEREHVGAGGSGRNGGILLPTLSAPGEPNAVTDALEADACELVALAEENHMDIDLRRGSIRLAISRGQAKTLVASARAGTDREYLDRDALREHVRSDRYTGGLLQRDTITLNPRKLLEGLAALAERKGVVVAEGTEVTEVKPLADGGVVVQALAGEVLAKRLVVAAGIGTGAVLPAYKKTLVTAYAQTAVTQPTDPHLLDSVLPSWSATSEIAAFTRYFRRLPGDRLLFGTTTMFDSIAGSKLEAQLRRDLKDTFPSLGNIPFHSAWEGAIAGTLADTPLLDRVAPSAVVTSSNGVLPSWDAGRVAARATDPAYAAYDFLRINQHGTWPPLGLPERLAKAGATGLFRIMDRI